MNAAIRTLLLAILTGTICWCAVKLTNDVRGDETQIAGNLITASQSLNRPCGGANGCGLIAGGVQAESAATGAILSANRVLQQSSIALQLVNHPCVPGPCGLLADVAKTLNTVRGTFGQVEIAANHEDRNLDTLDSQELQLFQHTDAALSSTDALIANFNTTLTGPDATGLLHNANALVYNAAAITADGKIEADRLTFPPKTPWYKKTYKIGLQSGQLLYDFIR